MTWWKLALYDTCSLITLDKLLLERATIVRHFPKRILALEKSFSADQMRTATVKRMKKQVTIQELPSPTDLSAILSSARLSTAFAEVDKLIFARPFILACPLLLEIDDLAEQLMLREFK